MQNYAEYCKVSLEYSVFCNIEQYPTRLSTMRTTPGHKNQITNVMHNAHVCDLFFMLR